MRGDARIGTGLAAPAGRFESVAAAAVLVLGILACLRLGRGYFLADDFVQLANFADWESRGELWREVAVRFAGSIDGVNGFYRPLTFLTYALNFTLGGAQPGRWLGVNLALHLGSAMMVGFLVARFARPLTRGGAIAALCAAIFFFAFAPVWEVAIWVSCRYDALATFFTLATGLLLLSDRRGWALVATVAALLSKESGAGAIVSRAWPPCCVRESRKSRPARGCEARCARFGPGSSWVSRTHSFAGWCSARRSRSIAACIRSCFRPRTGRCCFRPAWYGHGKCSPACPGCGGSCLRRRRHGRRRMDRNAAAHGRAAPRDAGDDAAHHGVATASPHRIRAQRDRWAPLLSTRRVSRDRVGPRGGRGVVGSEGSDVGSGSDRCSGPGLPRGEHTLGPARRTGLPRCAMEPA
jgi:Predicted membrane-bound dolichyl-phosphate-mannose-protein mannosyltransferase